MQKPVVIDFETESIQARPAYPPKPVGVAIMEPGKKDRYYAWGHPAANNSTRDEAYGALSDIWRGGRELLFHNAKFDLDVAEVHMGLPLPPWERVHDTLYLLFLTDPHAISLSLKPSAERILGLPPEERDAVKDWLVEHKVIAKNQGHGAFISKAPGDIVGKYAIGDVKRTKLLFERLLPKLDDRERRAYDRERELMPILLRNERQGLRFDVERAEKDLPEYEAALLRADDWLRKRLKVNSLNVDANEEVADALQSAGVVTEWAMTKTGKRSVAKANLTIDRFKDTEVFKVLGYRNRLATVLSLDLRPWAQAAGNGYIYTEWNQVRQSHGNDAIKGARTGRISCSRFMNVSKDFEDKNDGWSMPRIKLPPLPLVRKYLLPDTGCWWGHLDYNQQEFRITAHYSEGELLETYQKDPRTDYHTMMQKRLKEMAGLDLPRRPTKFVNFGIEYGMGAALLAVKLGVDVATAHKIIHAVKRAAPSLMALDRQLKEMGQKGDAIRTWGGRRYYCEPPKYVEKYKRNMTFEYKLLNYLIQGSAADCTKEAIIRYDKLKKDGRMLVTVHDEINISVPKPALKAECRRLQEAMESVEFDVPMLVDAEAGLNWGEMKPLKEIR